MDASNIKLSTIVPLYKSYLVYIFLLFYFLYFLLYILCFILILLDATESLHCLSVGVTTFAYFILLFYYSFKKNQKKDFLVPFCFVFGECAQF